MKINMLYVTLSVLFLSGCKMTVNTKEATGRVNEYGTIIVKSFEIGAFTPKEGEYGFKLYDVKKTKSFLSKITNDFRYGDIIEVDGLKWKKERINDIVEIATWHPYPNPPMPKLEEGEDRMEHFKEYSKWINDHPHFGYPPLPLVK